MTDNLYVFGSVTVDMYFRGNQLTADKERFHLAIGGKYTTDEFALRIGGGGANVAITTKRLGINTFLVAIIGQNSFEDLVRSDLHRYGLSDKYLISCPDYNNISSILLSKSGERTVINFRTPHCQHLSLKNSLLNLQNAHRDWIYMGGKLPDFSINEKSLLLNQLKNKGFRVCLNLSSMECEAGVEELGGLLANCDVLIQNKHEYSKLLKTTFENVDLKQNQLKILDHTFKGNLVITADGEGAYAYENNKVHFSQAYPPEKIIDTTGAGDAFSGAFLASLIKGEKVEHALTFASKNAGKKLASFGAH